MTVHEMIHRHPATMAVFSRYGIDSCCGGSATIAVAVARHGVERQQLIDELLRAVVDGVPA